MITENEQNQLHEQIVDTVEEIVHLTLLNYTKPDYIQRIKEESVSYLCDCAESQDWLTDDIEETIGTEVNQYVDTYLTECLQMPPRQSTEVLDIVPQPNASELLTRVHSFPVQKQRSLQWYEIRYTLFSASNLWKIFASSSQYNSLIYEKCKPMEISNPLSGPSNARSPMNWGIKYEPVSVMIYEDKFATKVSTEYGCIPHTKYPIGASPDGINIDPLSNRYGHMLEIKNIYNREITGIPSEEYWVQMQIQMETTGLQYCDFLETRIKECETREDFNVCTEQYKGVVLYFIPNDIRPMEHTHFVYMPLHVDDVDAWIESQRDSWESTHHLYETTYWYLDELSCVLVERNSIWFAEAVPRIEEAWRTVVKERVDGYEHRAPQKRKPSVDVVDVQKEGHVSSTVLSSSSSLGDIDTLHHLKNVNLFSNNVCLIKLDENGNVTL